MSFIISKGKHNSTLLIPQSILEKKYDDFYQDNQKIFNLIQFSNKQNHNNVKQTPTITNSITNGRFDTYQIHDPLQAPRFHQIDSSIENEKQLISIKDLRNNDRKILEALIEETRATYSFKSLVRKLDIHQQSLARALKRLVELNLIENTTTGYKLIEKNCLPLISILQYNKQLEDDKESLVSEIKKAKKRFNQMIQIRIPIKSNIDSIVNHLAGKWFGNLRWHGLIKKETGFILQWAVINKYDEKINLFQINLHIVSEDIVIESNASTDKNKIEAISYSNRLVREIADVLQESLKQKEEYEIPAVEFPTSEHHSISTTTTTNATTNTYTNNVKVKSKKNK